MHFTLFNSDTWEGNFYFRGLNWTKGPQNVLAPNSMWRRVSKQDLEEIYEDSQGRWEEYFNLCPEWFDSAFQPCGQEQTYSLIWTASLGFILLSLVSKESFGEWQVLNRPCWKLYKGRPIGTSAPPVKQGLFFRVKGAGKWAAIAFIYRESSIRSTYNSNQVWKLSGQALFKGFRC